MKLCGKCKEEKEYIYFHKNRARHDGLCNYCKECSKKKPINKEKAKARYLKWKNSEKGTEYFKEYYKSRKEEYTERRNKWIENNKERWQELQRKHSKTDKCKKRHKYQQAKRRAQKMNATFEGFDEEIKEIYKNCPEGYHVDHIYPLLHDKMCGLHVPWNLQYLPASENISKNNRLPEEYYESK